MPFKLPLNLFICVRCFVSVWRSMQTFMYRILIKLRFLTRPIFSLLDDKFSTFFVVRFPQLKIYFREVLTVNPIATFKVPFFTQSIQKSKRPGTFLTEGKYFTNITEKLFEGKRTFLTVFGFILICC